ncbi:MAG TPA: 2-dehydropantoate 2-reductase [Anaerolineae bacterium]|nr:2-dehydropantoate 2-reductase [Anaerolineae bacterium]
MSTNPPILIVGTGAMACLFGARLAQHADVTLLGTWIDGVKALQERGVRLVDEVGSERVFSVRATTDPEDLADIRHALVLVKSWQTERAAHQLMTCLAQEGLALTLQNGLGNLEQLQKVLGEERAAMGITTMGATSLGPGHVRVGGVGPTHLGSHPRLEPMVALFRQAELRIEIAEDIEGLVWGKLAINAAINPLTALLGIPNGELLTRPHALALMTEAAREAAAVAAARGINLPYADPGAAAVEVAGRTASNLSSMLQDVRRGAPTEIDAISRAIANEGESLGVWTPVNRVLWHLVRALASSAHGDAA